MFHPVTYEPEQSTGYYDHTQSHESAVDFVDRPWPNDQVEQLSTQRRRASHNAVERRRRDTITEKIRELGTLIPEDFVDLESGRFSVNERQQKSVVLKRSVEYMRHLQEQLDRTQAAQTALLQRIAELEANSMVKQESEFGYDL